MEIETFRENPYKLATIILAVLCIGLIFLYTIQREAPEVLNEIEVCANLKVVPSWVDSSGKVTSTGYNNFRMASPNYIVKLLKQDRVNFFYSSACPYCEKQIEWFNKSWEDYVNANLTHDCNEIKNRI